MTTFLHLYPNRRNSCEMRSCSSKPSSLTRSHPSVSQSTTCQVPAVYCQSVHNDSTLASAFRRDRRRRATARTTHVEVSHTRDGNRRRVSLSQTGWDETATWVGSSVITLPMVSYTARFKLEPWCWANVKAMVFITPIRSSHPTAVPSHVIQGLNTVVCLSLSIAIGCCAETDIHSTVEKTVFVTQLSMNYK